MTTTYNGWANRATWNVALWLGNDEVMYHAARAAIRHPRHYGQSRWNGAAAKAFCTEVFGDATPDGDKLSQVRWGAIAKMMTDL